MKTYSLDMNEILLLMLGEQNRNENDIQTVWVGQWGLYISGTALHAMVKCKSVASCGFLPV